MCDAGFDRVGLGLEEVFVFDVGRFRVRVRVMVVGRVRVARVVRVLGGGAVFSSAPGTAPQ